MQPTSPTLPDDALADITRRYARFSHSAAGLGGVIGGVLVLVTYFVGALALPESVWGRLALAATPIVWIACKELLRNHFYQRLGRVAEPWSGSQRRWHIGITAFTAVVSVVVVGGLAYLFRDDPAAFLHPQALGYLAFVIAMPFLVWRYMRTPLEFIVGVFLVAQAAVVLGGGSYPLGHQPQAPIAALAFIVLGARQHLEFRSLRRDLAARGIGA